MIRADVLVVGGGPAGYPCAFRAADLGLRVVLVDERSSLGGVCLHEGCIPSKAWLEPVKLINELRAYRARGLMEGEDPRINVEAMRSWMKTRVLGRLGQGLGALAKRRGVQYLQGVATFDSAHVVRVRGASGDEWVIEATSIVLATGSEPMVPESVPKDARILTSTEAIEMPATSGRLLVIGAGVIGCELAGVFQAIGLEVHVCDAADRILPMLDESLAGVVAQSLQKQGIHFSLSSRYESIDAQSDAIEVLMRTPEGLSRARYDWVLLAMGRRPRVRGLGLEALGVSFEQGALVVNERFETSVPGIYAIGDAAGGQLAHEATAQGRCCAELLAGQRDRFDVMAMPMVAYTYPELAWVGATEASLRASQTPFKVHSLPWQFNGRALASLKEEGMTKLLVDPSGRILGGGCVGVGAGDLISELALAIEMQADISDVALTVHPHPTFSETIALAAEVLEGTATDQ